MAVPTSLIRASVHAPPFVEVPPNRKKVKVDVRTELTNISEDDYVLHAPNLDEEVFWHVLDEDHREILREQPPRRSGRPRAGVEAFRTITIAAGRSDHETETLTLDAEALEDGHTYRVRAEIFGQVAEDEFVAVKPKLLPLTPLRAPKRKAAKKTKAAATAKKAPAKKAPAKKSAAKKSAAKKRAAEKPKRRSTGAGKKK